MNRLTKSSDRTAFPGRAIAGVTLALVLLLALFATPSAQAVSGVAGYFGFYQDNGDPGATSQARFINDAPGEMLHPTGIAVNGAGVGTGADPGDVYVADPGGNQGGGDATYAPPESGRIQQFSASGDLVRLWGRDVVKLGPDQADEAQRVTVDATGGSFRLGFPHVVGRAGGWLGSHIDGPNGGFWVPSAEVSQLAISSGFFEVGQMIEGPGIAAGTTVAAVDVAAGTMTLSQPASIVVPGHFGDPGPPASLLGIDSVSHTPDLPHDATAVQVQAALNALPAVSAGGGSVTVTGGPGGSSSTPYLVTFDGGPLAGADQPLLQVESGSTPLSGGAAGADAVTVNPGGEGFEICEPSAGDTCKHATGLDQSHPDSTTAGSIGSGNIALDQANGAIYAGGRGKNRITRFAADGSFEVSWGKDVVASGPDDSSADERQTVALGANTTGGSFTLSFRLCFSSTCPQATTTAIPFDAGAGQVQSALDGLSTIGGLNPPGSTQVTGAPGGPWTVEFGGALGGDDLQPLSADATGLTVSGGSRSVKVATVIDGGAAEACRRIDVCAPLGVGAPADEGLALAPLGTPNQGDLLGEDETKQDQEGVVRGGAIEENGPDGAFVRSFGGGVVDGGAAGAADLSAGSYEVSNVVTSEKAFVAGQAIGGAGIPAGTKITSVDAGTMVLSQPATSSGTAVALSVPPGDGNVPADEQQTVALGANTTGGSFALTFTTSQPSASSATAGSIPYNDSAPDLQARLAGLANVGAGNVAVSGPNGGPWAITFQGSRFADTDVNRISSNASGLTVSSGSKSVSVSTPVEGASAFEVCTAASGDLCRAGKQGTGAGQFKWLRDVAEDSSGVIYTVEGPEGGGSPDGPPQGNYRLQKFTPAGGLDLVPAPFGADEVQSVSVNADAGQFRLRALEPLGSTGTGTGDGKTTFTNFTVTQGEFEVGQQIAGNAYFRDTTITAVGPGTISVSRPVGSSPQTLRSSRFDTTADLPYDTTAAQVQAALNALPAIADHGSVTVSGPDGGPFAVSFDGGRWARTDAPQLLAAQGSTALSGGSGPGAGTANVTTPAPGGPGGFMIENSPFRVAIGAADHLLVARSYPPNVATCADGSSPPAETRIQELDPSGAVLETSAPCGRIVPTETGGGGDFTFFDTLAADPVSGDAYLLKATNNFVGPPRQLYVISDVGPPPVLSLNPISGQTSTGAAVSGEITPKGPVGFPPSGGFWNPNNTLYAVDYKKPADSQWTTYVAGIPVGAGSSPAPFHVGISGLEPNTSYEARVIVEKPFGEGTVIGPTQIFTTLTAPPSVDAFSSANVGADVAELKAKVNPRGLAASYHFEYGRTLAYGHSTPETPIGNSFTAQAVADQIADLEPVVYHFRVVATSSAGTTTSPDQTFAFYPEPCPNAAVRQQTAADFLPDCRAYELVSPDDAGTALLIAGGAAGPLAGSPSRLGFFADISPIPGPWNPPAITDQYVATRTDTGWQTHFVGFPADITTSGQGSLAPNGTLAGMPASADLNRFLQFWNSEHTYIAPYVWDAEGSSHGRVPTNVGDVPLGDRTPEEGGPVGDIRFAADGSHYFFSTANVAFAPGGKTSAGGSVYDNNIAAGTVTKVSVRNDLTDIPREPGNQSNDYMMLPGASADGTHILMAAGGTGLCGQAVCQDAPSVCATPGDSSLKFRCPLLPSHLYMRVNNAVTYDVSAGHVVTYEGMSARGDKVFFSSDQPVTPDDHDTSIDLYVWRESDDSVTRVSAGTGGVGDLDACNPSWIAKCGVQVVPSSGMPQPGPSSFNDGTDNAIAAGDGIFFYSPEQLVGSDGIPGRRNLYLYRGGQLRYVATLDVDKPLTRIQVSPDGAHAAFVTNSRLTAYDNAPAGGKECVHAPFSQLKGIPCQEVYVYEADSGALSCASCLPSGDPPSFDVEVSKDGAFMSDDGRAFFATKDALVPSDTNAGIDVYEYVGARSRLITSGVGVGDRRTGLVGVDANGTDVYFITQETLVAGDHNGAYYKFYDARTNGGFPQPAPQIPCAAADECHGPSNSSPSPARLASTGSLGNSGNAHKAPRKRHKHRKRHRRHRGKAHGKPRSMRQGDRNQRGRG